LTRDCRFLKSSVLRLEVFGVLGLGTSLMPEVQLVAVRHFGNLSERESERARARDREIQRARKRDSEKVREREQEGGVCGGGAERERERACERASERERERKRETM